MNKGFAIAIDGPVASGKGTLAPKLAEKLNGFYLDTGAMYRCVAVHVLDKNIDINDKDSVEKIAREIEIDFRDGKTFINGADVSDRIREPQISRLVPIVAGFDGVRKELISKQQNIAKSSLDNGKVFIAEGRDIATIVLPHADFKLYLTANQESRAKRRQEQLATQGENIDIETVKRDIDERDRKDIEVNKTLVKNPAEFGYEILDNSDMVQEQTLEAVVDLLKKKGLV